MENTKGVKHIDETDSTDLDTMFEFMKASIDALNTIKGYGKAEFICPICGSKSFISKSRGNGGRTGIWSQCGVCGMRIIS